MNTITFGEFLDKLDLGHELAPTSPVRNYLMMTWTQVQHDADLPDGQKIVIDARMDHSARVVYLEVV